MDPTSDETMRRELTAAEKDLLERLDEWFSAGRITTAVAACLEECLAGYRFGGGGSGEDEGGVSDGPNSTAASAAAAKTPQEGTTSPIALAASGSNAINTDVVWIHANRALFAKYANLIDELLDKFVDERVADMKVRRRRSRVQGAHDDNAPHQVQKATHDEPQRAPSHPHHRRHPHDADDDDDNEGISMRDELAMQVAELSADASDDDALRCEYLAVSYIAAALSVHRFEQLLLETQAMKAGFDDADYEGEDDDANSPNS